MGITQTEYDKKRTDIEKEIFDIQTKQKSHIGADNTFVSTIESVFLVVSKAGELFKSSKVEQKRALLNLLLSNCTLKGGTLRYSLNKPFDMLVNLTTNEKWSCLIINLRTIKYDDLRKKISKFFIVFDNVVDSYL